MISLVYYYPFQRSLDAHSTIRHVCAVCILIRVCRVCFVSLILIKPPHHTNHHPLSTTHTHAHTNQQTSIFFIGSHQVCACGILHTPNLCRCVWYVSALCVHVAGPSRGRFPYKKTRSLFLYRDPPVLPSPRPPRNAR